MRFDEKNKNAARTPAGLPVSASRAARALLCLATLLPALMLWGCSGIVSGTNTAQALPQTFSISGTISPVAGGNGATVVLSGAASATTTANSSGNFTFSGLANGTYTLTPSHAGYTFNPGSVNVTVSGANIATGVNFTATQQTNPTFSISGTISPTAGGSGATVTLSGATSATTTANSAGSYTFPGLANGTYAVTPSLTGYTFSPSSQSATVNGANVTGVNFTANAQVGPTFSISGTISLVGGGSAANVPVLLSGAAGVTTVTSNTGTYTFPSLPSGAYVVTPSSTSYSFTPVNQSVTISSANVTGVNFTAAAQVPHTVALTWNASTSTVTGYNIYRSTVSGTGYAKISTLVGSVLTYTDSAVLNGTTYYYVTTAVDSTGVESIFSNEVTAVIP